MQYLGRNFGDTLPWNHCWWTCYHHLWHYRFDCHGWLQCFVYGRVSSKIPHSRRAISLDVAIVTAEHEARNGECAMRSPLSIIAQQLNGSRRAILPAWSTSSPGWLPVPLSALYSRPLYLALQHTGLQRTCHTNGKPFLSIKPRTLLF